MQNVIYKGHATQVIGPDGLLFPRGKSVEVSDELARTLGPDFEPAKPDKQSTGKEDSQ